MDDFLWMYGQFFAALFGLIIGSFMNVCIARWPVDQSVTHPRSRCPRCHGHIGWRDLVPVLSWLYLRGECRHCKAPISPGYPLIEILGMLLSILAWRRFVPDTSVLDMPHVTAWFVFYGFFCMLVVATYSDIRHRIIPDEVSIYSVPLGIAGIALLEFVGYAGWGAISWQQSITGAAIAGGGLGVAALAAEGILKREALGWGDVKLLAMIGAFVGPFAAICGVLLLGSLLGAGGGIMHLAITRRRALLPFGAALAPAAIAWVLFGDLLLPVLFPGITMRFGIG